MELSLVQCKNCKHLEKITNEYLCPFDWCENVLDSPDRDLQRRCKHYQAATNADRIRSMTDEELAKKISGIESFALTCGGGWPPEKWLDWLKQEVKDG
jgi:hypothetical protein